MATAADARDGFVTYDEMRGPDLDAARWSPARLPLPTGGEHIPLDPNAELAVGEGEVRVTIPRFSLSHDTFQAADSPKYLMFSTGQFELPPDRPATFAVDLAVKNIGGEPGDFRRGMAAFHAFDLEVSRRVFAVHSPFMHSSCFAAAAVLHVSVAIRGLRRRLHPLRACEITLDRSRSTAPGASTAARCTRPTAPYPDASHRVRDLTMLPIRTSRPPDGQGMNARWRRFRVRGVDV